MDTLHAINSTVHTQGQPQPISGSHSNNMKTWRKVAKMNESPHGSPGSPAHIFFICFKFLRKWCDIIWLLKLRYSENNMRIGATFSKLLWKDFRKTLGKFVRKH